MLASVDKPFWPELLELPVLCGTPEPVPVGFGFVPEGFAPFGFVPLGLVPFGFVPLGSVCSGSFGASGVFGLPPGLVGLLESPLGV
ncbi:hypothetical protein C6575_14815 [Nocardia seriolae]|nr:hypothetical protein C6575_14815 [Nocardia seriolae]